jgi:hypothetical protein
MTSVAAAVNGATGDRLTWLMGAGGTRPSPADLVAEAVVSAAEDEHISGVVNVDGIEALGKHQS